MNQKFYDLNKYKAGRTVLLLVGIFTAVNCLLQAFDAGYQLLYAAALPQIGLAFKGTLEFYGVSPIISIGLLTVIPILLFFICYFMSKNNTRWMLAGLALFILDALVLIFFWYLTGFSADMILNLVFEGVIIFELISAVLAGKRLDGNLEEIEMEMQQEMSNPDRSLYAYDKQYAKENKVAKGGMFAVVLIGYIVISFLALLLLIIFDGNPVAVILFALLMIGSLVFLIVGMIKLSPFVSASNFAFYKEGDVVYRTSVTNAALAVPLNNLQVFEEKPDVYLCTYEDNKGKQRKMSIPKAYPGIEEIIK
ncbi:MAG: hypothetical protein IKX74_07330 [Erysipelotrichaceae bacterium]|nr:hypothetical protein [Erysipelotrichaceae bacterium]